MVEGACALFRITLTARERARELRMTSSMSSQPCHLREEDILGAALNGRKPEQLKIPESFGLLAEERPLRAKRQIL